MKRNVFLFLFFSAFSLSTLFAQQARFDSRNEWMDKLQIVGGIGMINFLGELGGADDIGRSFLADFDLLALRPNFHAGVRYQWGRFFSNKAFVNYGWVVGNDAWTRNQFRNSRNLSFRSPLLDFGVTGEFYFLPQLPTKGRHNRRGLNASKGRTVLGYISTGVVGFWFDPSARAADGTVHSLQPLGTEGQYILPTRSPYSRTQIAIPMGFGFQFKFTDDLSLDVEISYRKTFTDYIDDVSMTFIDPILFADPYAREFHDRNRSITDPTWAYPGGLGIPTGPGEQRGNPQDHDAYIYMQFSLNWKLGAFGSAKAKYNR